MNLKILLFLLILFLVITAGHIAAFDGEVPEADIQESDSGKESEAADPDELLRIADEKIFQRIGFSEKFSRTQGYVNEILDPDVIHQYYVRDGRGTDLLMSMFPAEKTVRTGNKRLNITKGLMDEFHVSYTMQRTENVPSGTGGSCWMRYSNYQHAGSGKESGVILIPGDRAYFFRQSETDPVCEPIADLSELDPDHETVFDFIRLDGVTYFYADGKYLFSYADGITVQVSFEGGAVLNQGGNRIRCDFDNFTMMYR